MHTYMCSVTYTLTIVNEHTYTHTHIQAIIQSYEQFDYVPVACCLKAVMNIMHYTLGTRYLFHTNHHFAPSRKKKGQSYQSSSTSSKAVYQPNIAAVECDYAEVAEKEGHLDQSSVIPGTPSVAPLECEYAVVNKKKSSDKPPAVGEVDGVSQARMPPAKPSPYNGTLMHNYYSFVTEHPPFLGKYIRANTV